MKVLVGLVIILFIFYLVDILRAMHRLSKVRFMINVLQSFLADLHPLYLRVCQNAKRSGEIVSHTLLDEQFTKELKRKKMVDSYDELTSLVPDIGKLHPYLIRYVCVGEHYDVLTNYQGMLQLNKFLLEFEEQVTAERKVAFNPLNAILKLLRFPTVVFRIFHINIQTGFITYTISLLIWFFLGFLYYYRDALYQIFKSLFP